MTVVSRLFNGSTFTLGGTAAPKLSGMSFSENGNWIEVTQPDDLNKLFEVSPQPEFSLRLRFKGGGAGALVYATKGTAAITWKDGTTTTCPGTWQVGPKTVEGDWDAPISSTAELRPTVPDSA